MPLNKSHLVISVIAICLVSFGASIANYEATAFSNQPDVHEGMFSPAAELFEQLGMSMAKDQAVRSALQGELTKQFLEGILLTETQPQSAKVQTQSIEPAYSMPNSFLESPLVSIGLMIIKDNDLSLTFYCHDASLVVYGNYNKLTLLGPCSNLIIRGDHNWVMLEYPTAIVDTGEENIIPIPMIMTWREPAALAVDRDYQLE